MESEPVPGSLVGCLEARDITVLLGGVYAWWGLDIEIGKHVLVGVCVGDPLPFVGHQLPGGLVPAIGPLPGATLQLEPRGVVLGRDAAQILELIVH